MTPKDECGIGLKGPRSHEVGYGVELDGVAIHAAWPVELKGNRLAALREEVDGVVAGSSGHARHGTGPEGPLRQGIAWILCGKIDRIEQADVDGGRRGYGRSGCRRSKVKYLNIVDKQVVAVAVDPNKAKLDAGPEIPEGRDMVSRRQWLAMEGVKVVVCAALLASAAPNFA